MEDLIIVGSGPAGYTAGIYGARSGFNPVIITGIAPGGQLTTTTEVDNWPGDSNNLMGPELMERMKVHCEKLGCRIVSDSITKVSFADSPDSPNSSNSPNSQPSQSAPSTPLKLYGSSNEYSAKAIILATGASPRMLGLENESQYMGRGLSTCATCDGFFFKGKELAVIGGGNTAVEEAIFLSNIASKVTLIHRRDELRADKVLQDKLFKLEKEGKIAVLWNKDLIAYEGDDKGISGAVLRGTIDGEESTIKVAGIFVAIGHIPNSDFLGDALELNDGYVKIHGVMGPGFTATSVAGVFAGGDIADYYYRQAITSAGMGCMAALDARHFLTK